MPPHLRSFADLQLRALYWDVYPITYGRARLAWTIGTLNADG